MPIPFVFDFKKPDYVAVFKRRAEKLKKIRKNPEILPKLRAYYKENPAQFIIDWGCTIDPRNIEKGLPSLVPFLLFEKQEEWIKWSVECWKKGEFCLTEKSRDMGASWMAVALSVTLCLFHDGMTIGFGSRKEDSVDKSGDPQSIFYKVREFIKTLPREFRGGWNERKNSAHMRISFPHNGAAIIGEAGPNMGRGGRVGIYFVDEAAHLEHPLKVEAALSNTTNCRHDISTPYGMANPFAIKRHSGNIPVFVLDWRDHPAKDQAWYEAAKIKIGDPVIIAQELDRDYTASVPDIVIPAIWVNAAIDAHIKLGMSVSGVRKTGFDVADQGRDKNSLVARHGVLLSKAKAWSGKGDDIFVSTQKTFEWCDVNGHTRVDYDADGLGASVRGDAKVINEERTNKVDFHAFHGSGEVVDPGGDAFGIAGREAGIKIKNKDHYKNAKAQAWFSLRRRFEMTYLVVNGMANYSHDELISIDSKMENINQLKFELSQPTYQTGKSGKIIINKKPEGALSPNLADAAVIVMAPEGRVGARMHVMDHMSR